MLRRKTIILFVLLGTVILFVSCMSEEDKMNKTMRALLLPFRLGHIFNDEERRSAREFYNACYRLDLEKINECLKSGADPNYCLGEAGWFDSNPLSVVANRFYATYYRKRRNETIPIPAPDETALNILLEAGADINQRPYIWERVIFYGNGHISDMTLQRRVNNEPTDPESMQEEIDVFVSDANRLIAAFIRAGADPDKLGHLYPYREGIIERITDEQANEYLARGTRAINKAIEKGILWESQVDLLLQYTNLDEESLRAAERSNDPAMVEKIENLWREQQKR